MLKGTQCGIKVLTGVRERRPPTKKSRLPVISKLCFSRFFFLFLFLWVPLESTLEDGAMSAESLLTLCPSNGAI